HDAPAISFHTFVGAGSVDDAAAHTGLARLFERVAFTGTETIGSRNWPEEHKAIDAVEALFDQWEAERNLGPRASQSRIDRLETQLRVAIDNSRRYGLPEAYSATIEDNGGTRLTVN